MYNLAKTLSDSYSSVSLHALKSLQKHFRRSSHGGTLKKKNSLPSFPLSSFEKLIDKAIKRSASQYTVHPEKLKQIIKASESQTLCNFFGSAEYQKRLKAIMESQKRLLSEGSPIGIPESEIKYEHIISCAQPILNLKNEEKEEKKQEEREVVTLLENKKKKKPVRTTIMSLILRKKKQEQEDILARRGQSTIMPLVMQTKMKNLEMKRKFRRRTTILPILLQRMEQIKERTETGNEKSEEELLNSYYKIKKLAAPKSKKIKEVVLYQKKDHGSDKNEASLDSVDESNEIKDTSGSSSFIKGGKLVSKNSSFSTPRPEKLSEPTKIIVEDGQSDPQGSTPTHSSSRQSDDVERQPEKKKPTRRFWGEFVRKWKRSSKRNPRKQEVSNSCLMNFPLDAQYHIDPSFVDIIDVSHIPKLSSRPVYGGESPQKVPDKKEFKFFSKLKKGKSKASQSAEDEISTTSDTKSYVSRTPSLTYKTVCDHREMKKKILRENCLTEVDVWKRNLCGTSTSKNANKKQGRESRRNDDSPTSKEKYQQMSS